MKLTIDKKDFLNLLSRAQNIVEKKNTMPILVNVLVVADKDQLNVFATDLEVSLTDQVQAHVEQDGKVAVNAKSLYEIIKEMPDGLIQLEKKENNWLQISQNKAVFNIVGISPDEYPVFPTFSTKDFMKIDPAVLAEMIEKTIFSVSTDETRYHLNGVYFERQPSEQKSVYRMVATDGHRLSLIDKDAQSSTKSSSSSAGVIIPRKGLNEIKKLLDSGSESFEMAIEGSQLIARSGSTVLMIRLIEGKYPNYKQLIPQNLAQNLTVEREALLHSLRRVSLLSSHKSKGVTFHIGEGRMEITSNNPELGDAKEELAISYVGKDLKIGFNAKYILDVLGSIKDDEVEIEFNDQLSPGLVRPKNDKSYTCVVMPMRI